jgi:hypothetical protein
VTFSNQEKDTSFLPTQVAFSPFLVRLSAEWMAQKPLVYHFRNHFMGGQDYLQRPQLVVERLFHGALELPLLPFSPPLSMFSFSELFGSFSILLHFPVWLSSMLHGDISFPFELFEISDKLLSFCQPEDTFSVSLRHEFSTLSY